MDALLLANDVRVKRAKLKTEIKAGVRSVLDALNAPPPEAVTMKVFDLLLAVPKYGRIKVNKMLARVQISPSKTVGGLSPRQRRELYVLIRREMEAREARRGAMAPN